MDNFYDDMFTFLKTFHINIVNRVFLKMKINPDEGSYL